MAKSIWTEDKIRQITDLYLTHTREEIRQIMGLTEPQVRSRLMILGLNHKRDANWTEEDVAMLISAYSGVQYSEDINLPELAKRLGRHKTNVSRKARDLGLTDAARKVKKVRKIKQNVYATVEERNQAISVRAKESIRVNGHPKGMLGKKHTDEARAIMSALLVVRNRNRTPEQVASSTLKACQTRERNGTLYSAREKTTWKAGWREFGGIRKYYRSRWEANYGRYLQWLKERGEILDWKHEPKTFWFEGIKRGTNSYLPDFLVTEKNGQEVYHEVKGWMDDRSKTKIKRMAKYHPQIKLIVIEAKAYNSIKKQVSKLVPDWE